MTAAGQQQPVVGVLRFYCPEGGQYACRRQKCEKDVPKRPTLAQLTCQRQRARRPAHCPVLTGFSQPHSNSLPQCYCRMPAGYRKIIPEMLMHAASRCAASQICNSRALCTCSHILLSAQLAEGYMARRSCWTPRTHWTAPCFKAWPRAGNSSYRCRADAVCVRQGLWHRCRTGSRPGPHLSMEEGVSGAIFCIRRLCQGRKQQAELAGKAHCQK